MRPFSDLRGRRHPDNDLPAGVVVLRPEGVLSFGYADHVRAVVRLAAPTPPEPPGRDRAGELRHITRCG